MKAAPFLLLIIIACNQPKSQGDKFYVRLQLEIGSAARQGTTIEFKTDSVIAPSLVAAADSLILRIFGWQHVDSLSRDNYARAGAADYKFGGFKVRSAQLYDYTWTDITATIPDSVIELLVAKRRIDLSNLSIGRVSK